MGSGASKGGSYKLTYFNGRGRGEVARLCFAAAGVKFVDNRVEQADWPSVKEKTPLGFLPVLQLDGKELTQTVVINRFLAERFGLFGSNPMEKAKIDEIMVTIGDFAVEMSGIFFAKEDAKTAAVKAVLEVKAPMLMKYLLKAIEANQTNSGYLVGGKLSVADLALFNCCETLAIFSANEMDKYAKLKAVITKVGSNSNIAKYIEGRPETPF